MSNLTRSAAGELKAGIIGIYSESLLVPSGLEVNYQGERHCEE